MITARCPIRVRYAETDAMGVAYHGNYFTWFEAARVHLLDEVGLPYREIESRGLMLPVLEAHAEFRKPARFDDRLEVEVTITEKPGVRLRIDYRVRRPGDGEDVLCEGYTRHAFMDRSGRAARPDRQFLDLMKRHFG